MCYDVSTALRTIVETRSSIIGCVVFILRQVTAMCYEPTALCALIITSVLTALCAGMYFYLSTFCYLLISYLSTAVRTTITAVLQARRFVVAIVVLFLASALVRYVISLDYKEVIAVLSVDFKAQLAVGVAIGAAPRIGLELLACIVDMGGRH